MIQNMLNLKTRLISLSQKKYIIAQLSGNLYHLFSSSKNQIVQQLREMRNQKTLAKLGNYQKFVSLIQFDLSSQSTPKYFYYSQIKAIFQAYVQEIVTHTSFKQYNPQQITLDGARISKLFSLISSYPYFSIEQQPLKYSYQIFYRFLNARTESELNSALLFALKVDPKAEESNIFGEFLTFYLEHRWERIKAKYQLNIRKQSIGEIAKKVISGFVHRGYLRRTPQYLRPLSIQNGEMVLRLLLENPSTRSSLMIRKVVFKQLFMPIVEFYEKEMKKNLYHEKNSILWESLNKNSDVIFKENELTEKQCQYLRELYVTLFLVLNQQNKVEQVRKSLPSLLVALDYIKNNYESHKSKQFVNEVEDFCQKITSEKFKDLSLSKNIFMLISKFPQHSTLFMQIIAKQLVPLTFSIYFNELLNTMVYWEQSVIAKITGQNQQNLLKYISFLQMLSIVDGLSNISRKPYKVAIYKHLLKTTIQKQFVTEPTNEQAIHMLTLYQKKKLIQLQTNDIQLVEQLEMLRLFLFRFISDIKNTFKNSQLQQIADILLSLDDSSSFADDQGNYQLNIYQELQETVERSFLSTQLRNTWKRKVGAKEDLNPLAGILKKLGQS